jgi:hypothetical protein
LKRRGRKSASQTPAPPKDRIKGSSTNPKGSAASQSSASSITLSDKIIATLEKKKDEYNAKHSSKVSLNTLKAVMRRGMGAFSTSYRPTITGGRPNSRQAWGFARVNKFLLKKGGTKVKAAYVQDDDLMAKGGKIGQEITCVNCGWHWNTNQSDEFDKYVCHRCGFDNRTFYDSDPIGKYHLGGDMSKHLAPNGKSSNLTHEQWHLVRTPEFKAWFGNWENEPRNASKVVDENGEPLVVYHGTYAKEQFNFFDFDKADLGFHFGTYEQAKDRSETKIGVKGYKSIVNPYFLNIREQFNILDVGEFEYPQKYITELIANIVITEKEAKENNFDRAIYRQDNKKIRDFLKAKYGENVGFEYDNKIEGEGKSFIALHPNQIKLADGSNTTFDANNPDIRYEEGGELDLFKPTKSLKELSEIHNVSIGTLSKQLIKGIKTELEHTKNEEVAKTIALHHIEENPKYYDVLKKQKLEEGGEIVEENIIALPDTYAKEDSLKRVLNLQGYELKKIDEEVENEDIMKKGGMVVGKSHQEADENGTGEKFVVASTGQIVELEGGEAVIVNKAMDSTDELEFDGKKMKPREIASYLNHAYGGVKFEDGGQVTCGCTKKKYYHGGELPSSVVNGLEGGEAVITKKTMDSKDKYTFEGEKLTPRQILSRINHKYGGVSFARGGMTSGIKHSQENKASKMMYFLNSVYYG